MPENPLEQARFDHVDGAGDLVFAVGNLQFAVHVDDTLERAILEAKQIRSETRPAQPASTTLPISQIQSLIRAGADPVNVAQRYGLAEALVRRFSTAVETEKQYAIEQFLAVPAPKDTRSHTLAELIERTLASAGIGMEAVTWQATRRGLEPWRIVARFDSSGRHMRAEWTWNMHGNAVSCVNATAKRLLGERDEDSNTGSPWSDSDRSLSLPGDSLRSARIERAVSQWVPPVADHDVDSEPRPRVSQPLWNPLAHTTTTASRSAIQTNNETAVATWVGDTVSPVASASVSSRPSTQSDALHESPSSSTTAAPVSSLTSADHSATAMPAASITGSTAQVSGHTDAHTPATGHTSQPAQSASTNTQTTSEQSSPSHTGATATVRSEKRKTGRSPMPSWDEILFGE